MEDKKIPDNKSYKEIKDPLYGWNPIRLNDEKDRKQGTILVPKDYKEGD